MDNTAEQWVSHLQPLTQLGPERFQTLQDRSESLELPPNSRIEPDCHRRWFVYVLSGNVVRTDGTGKATLISGGSTQSQAPLFADAGDAGHAVSATHCTLLRFERQLFETLLNEEALDGYEVEDVEVNETESVLFQELYGACMNQGLRLPTMPEVAARIAQLGDDPDAGIPELVQIIQTDPTVAGSVLKVANSALYKGSSKTDNIKAAVIRLGLKTTRDLATSIALKETFQTRNPAVKKRLNQIWKHSVNISTFSYVIARRIASMDPEHALMAGLLHDVGAVAILTHVERTGLDSATEEMETAISKLGNMAGLLVLNNWGMDSTLEPIIEAAEDWWRDPTPEADYGDVVMVAHLCDAAQSGLQDGLPALCQLPVAGKLGLDTSDDALEQQLIDEAQEELADIRQMLQS